MSQLLVHKAGPPIGPAPAFVRWAATRDHTLLWRLLSLALFCGVWEVAGQIPVNYALPPFSQTFMAFVGMVLDGSLISAYATTLQPLVIGIVISAVIGVGIGILMGLKPMAEWLAAPVFIVMQAAPMAALIPLITFVYGIGMTSKVLSVCVLALPVIVLNCYKAVRNVNPSLVAMCRSFQGTRWQQVAKIVIPDASPLIFAGLRLGISAGFIGIVLADVSSPGKIDGFGLARWMRSNGIDAKIILAGTVQKAAAKAQDLCEDGPLLSKPYDHSLLLNRIKSEVAARARNGKPESDI